MPPFGAEDQNGIMLRSIGTTDMNPVWRLLPPRPSTLFRDFTPPTRSIVLAIQPETREAEGIVRHRALLDYMKDAGERYGTFVWWASRRAPTLWCELIKIWRGGSMNAHFA